MSLNKMEDNNPEESTMIPEMIVKVKKNVGRPKSKGETVTLLGGTSYRPLSVRTIEPMGAATGDSFSERAKTGADRIQKARDALEKKRALSIKQAPVPEELLRKIVSEEIEKKREIKKKEKEAAIEQRRLEEEKQQRKKEKLEKIKQEAIQEYVSKSGPAAVPPAVAPAVHVPPAMAPPRLSARDRLMKLYGY